MNEEIKLGSLESVAYALMKHIAVNEKDEAIKKDRNYWLTLYSQCSDVVRGGKVPITE